MKKFKRIRYYAAAISLAAGLATSGGVLYNNSVVAEAEETLFEQTATNGGIESVNSTVKPTTTPTATPTTTPTAKPSTSPKVYITNPGKETIIDSDNYQPTESDKNMKDLSDVKDEVDRKKLKSPSPTPSTSPTPTPDIPKTGEDVPTDDSLVLLYGGALIVIAAGAGIKLSKGKSKILK